MSDPSSFTDGENWTGGFYELAIELGDRDDQRLDAAIAAAWADQHLSGPFASRDHEPNDQAVVTACLAPTSPAAICVDWPNCRSAQCPSVVP